MLTERTRTARRIAPARRTHLMTQRHGKRGSRASDVRGGRKDCAHTPRAHAGRLSKEGGP